MVGPAFGSIIAGLTLVAAVLGILFALGMYLAGYGILKFFPVFTEQTLITMEQKSWQSVAVGAGLLFLSPFIALFLMFTVVGIPILWVLMLLAVVAWVFGNVYANYLVGRILLKQFGFDKSGRALALLVGSVVVWFVGFVLGLVPIVGMLFNFVVSSWGVGAIVMNKWEMVRNKKSSKK